MPSNKWSTGLFDVCDDCSSCCLTCFCPCIAHGMLSNAVNGGGECAPCCLYYITLPCGLARCVFGPNVRSNLRNKYDLMEAPCGDCCVHFYCHPCATCQEIREVKGRGGLPSGNSQSAEVPLHPKPQEPPQPQVINQNFGSPQSPHKYPAEYGQNVAPQYHGPAPGYSNTAPVPPAAPAPQYGFTPPPPQPPLMNYGNAVPPPPPVPGPPAYAPMPYSSTSPAASSSLYPPAAAPTHSGYPPM